MGIRVGGNTHLFSTWSFPERSISSRSSVIGPRFSSSAATLLILGSAMPGPPSERLRTRSRTTLSIMSRGSISTPGRRSANRSHRQRKPSSSLRVAAPKAFGRPVSASPGKSSKSFRGVDISTTRRSFRPRWDRSSRPATSPRHGPAERIGDGSGGSAAAGATRCGPHGRFDGSSIRNLSSRDPRDDLSRPQAARPRELSTVSRPGNRIEISRRRDRTLAVLWHVPLSSSIPPIFSGSKTRAYSLSFREWLGRAARSSTFSTQSSSDSRDSPLR